MKPLNKNDERGNCVLKSAMGKTTSLPHFISGSKNCSMSDKFPLNPNHQNLLAKFGDKYLLAKFGHKYKLEKIEPKTLGFILGNFLNILLH